MLEERSSTRKEDVEDSRIERNEIRENFRIDRREDIENLKQIATVSVQVKNIETQVGEVKTSVHEFKSEVSDKLTKLTESFNSFQLNVTKDFGDAKVEVQGLKKDVGWLKTWHNKIILGLVLSGAVGVVGIILNTMLKK